MARNDSIVERIEATIEQETREIDEFFAFPKWYPTYRRELYRRISGGILSDLRAALSVKPASQKIGPAAKRVDGSKSKRTAVYESPKAIYAHLVDDPLKTLRSWLKQVKSEDNPIVPGVFAAHHVPLSYELAYLEYVASLEPQAARKEFKKPDAWRNWKNVVGGKNSGKSRRAMRDVRKRNLDRIWSSVRAHIQSLRTEDVSLETGKAEWELVQNKFELTRKDAQECTRRFNRERKLKK